MTDETKAKLLDLYLSPAIPDAIDAHVRAVVEMLHPEDGQYPPSCLDASCVGADAEANRILLSRVSGALVDAGAVEVEPYDQAIRELTSERDEAMAGWRAATAAWDSDAQDSRVERGRLAARVAELEMAGELADAHESGYRSRITELEAEITDAVARLLARRGQATRGAATLKSEVDAVFEHEALADALIESLRARIAELEAGPDAGTCARRGANHVRAGRYFATQVRRLRRERKPDPGVYGLRTPCWDRVYKRPQAAAPARLDPSGTATGETITHRAHRGPDDAASRSGGRRARRT